eukprot:TRINITY_DN1998_c0_g1_i2.p1 TRINITY_DN1998_c0_g1~~TRINITY_DN1998_c0_g1_i2.p1  ORF type:complete len:496 (+),score=172.46 TRINITY_DN1998_c0_g1_i2:114-1490(+)
MPPPPPPAAGGEGEESLVFGETQDSLASFDEGDTMPPPPPPAGEESLAFAASVDGGGAEPTEDEEELAGVDEIAASLSSRGGSSRRGESVNDGTTFADVFGDEYYEEDFEARFLKADEVKGITEKLERNVTDNFVAKMWEDIFGDEPGTQEFLKQMDETERALTQEAPTGSKKSRMTGTGAVHNVSSFSAPDGKRYNPYCGGNRFFPRSNMYLTSMPTLDNYQCLHLPIDGDADNRRIKVTGLAAIPADRKPVQAGLQGAGQTYPGAIHTPHNMIRWRRKKGQVQSNARLMRFDNGDTVLRVGNDYFIIESHNVAQENQHLMGVHGNVLVQYAKVRKMWRLRALTAAHGRPNSTVQERARKRKEGTLPHAKVQMVEHYVPLDAPAGKEKQAVALTESDVAQHNRDLETQPSQGHDQVPPPALDDEEFEPEEEDEDAVAAKRAMEAREGEPVVKRRRVA